MYFLTAGESHGECICGILDGLPSNFKIDIKSIIKTLKLRQSSYGRGKRMKIETDVPIFTAGLIDKKTYGGAVAFYIKNKATEKIGKNLKIPRPGHSDLTGSLKYNLKDLSLPAECRGGRKTVAITVLGEIARQFLKKFGIEILGYTLSIGKIYSFENEELDCKTKRKYAENSSLRLLSKTKEPEIKELIDNIEKEGDTLGGKIKIIAENVPIGLGDFSQFDKSLDSRLSSALFSIPSIKAVSFGEGFNSSEMLGSEYQDKIYKNAKRKTNNAGGIEGGISNGENIEIIVSMKPIPTVKKGIDSINLETNLETKTEYIRSDTCAVPACAIVCEAMTSLIILEAFLDRFGCN
ncbi:chorismate synthase, partial [bacterium]|nr:chorismate synthase [bacterium]